MNQLSSEGKTIIACSHDPKIVNGTFCPRSNHKPVPRLVNREASAQGDTPKVAAQARMSLRDMPSRTTASVVRHTYSFSTVGVSGWCLGVVWELDIVSVATGKANLQASPRVQHLEGGIVAAILVREGGRVEAGQPLIELEPRAAERMLNCRFGLTSRSRSIRHRAG